MQRAGRPSPFPWAGRVLVRGIGISRVTEIGEKNFYLLFIKIAIPPSRLSKLQLQFFQIADKQGKTSLCPSQFILSWVRCRVAIDKFYVFVDEDGPPVLSFK